MELYLIRHGETVDNVAGLYAGVRDSALTIHGVEQARRLGEHFATNGVKFTHIFASPLSRAFKTAQAIETAQLKPDEDDATAAIEITQVPELIEQDFGYYEGKPFHARSDPKKMIREAHHEQHKDEPGFVDVESKESMNKRADVFLDGHLMPLLAHVSTPSKHIVAVVSHGMLLSHLWRRILKRLPSKSVTVNPEITAARGSIVLEHLGGWGNTGYLELFLSQDNADEVVKDAKSSEAGIEKPLEESSTETGTTEQNPSSSTDLTGIDPSTSSSQVLVGWSLLIRGIDRKDHLVGLKRQRGGIGRTAHDEKQQKIHNFFKRPRQF
ncbi:hypothetical protein M409DRAFT_62545 [Zasmidium cellare ATCC 36951]|uniref:Phosphoglycerate mutase-like protein n=1 Tax=Zasmidium cellare ATCC 36951 TaxID=1080233 RepID=A0A6A6D0D7_ZASCE|nr:uncharacterized protein M409DRAFT_62545 [Zasmidium cellare ATCC 36951]KAF2172884.1 hypothetical protein M409DRAFT_62545 [Zasmidium cellare ATCC 36951]